MDQYFVSLTLDTGQPRVNLRTEVTGGSGSFPFGRKTEGGAGKVFVRAHDGAPEIAFEVQLGGKFLWSGKVTTEHIEIEEAIVVEVGETSAPGPAGVHHRHPWRLQTGDLLEFAAGLLMVKPVARGRFSEHLVQSWNSGGHAAASLTVHIRDVKVFAAIIVVITPGSAHGEAVRGQASFGSHVREAGRPVIAKQHVGTPVVGDVQVRPSVLVVIAPGRLKRVAPDANSAVLGRWFETPPTAIDQQNIWGTELVEHAGAVALLVFGQSAFVFLGQFRREELIRPIKVTFFDLGDATGGAGANGSGGPVSAEVDIKQAIAVVIGRGHGNHSHRHVIGNGVLIKMAASVFEVGRLQETTPEHHIKIAVVVKVGEKRASRMTREIKAK